MPQLLDVMVRTIVDERDLDAGPRSAGDDEERARFCAGSVLGNRPSPIRAHPLTLLGVRRTVLLYPTLVKQSILLLGASNSSLGEESHGTQAN